MVEINFSKFYVIFNYFQFDIKEKRLWIFTEEIDQSVDPVLEPKPSAMQEAIQKKGSVSALNHAN
jgi:hypothetical protein